MFHELLERVLAAVHLLGQAFQPHWDGVFYLVRSLLLRALVPACRRLAITRGASAVGSPLQLPPSLPGPILEHRHIPRRHPSQPASHRTNH